MTEPTRKLGYRLFGIGALGVTLASVFYALAGAEAALPAPVLELEQALAATPAAAKWMQCAGVIGMPADVLLVVGAVLIALGRKGEAHGTAVAGWLALSVASLLFVFVDALVGFVLPPLAVAPGEQYAAFRQLFDVLFAFGTLVYGGGGLAVLLAPGQPAFRQKFLRAAALASSAAAVLAAVGFFAGVNLALLNGASIALGTLAFAGLTLRAEPAV